nr:unnamed protein product [Digitaria exilis]
MPSAMVDATVAAPPLDVNARRHRHRAAALSNANSNNAAKTVASRYLSPFSKPATSSISSATASRPPRAVATNAMASCGSATTTTTTRTLAVAFQSPAYSLDTSSRARSASPVAVPPAPTPEKKKKKQSGAAGTAAGSAKVFDASQNTYRWQPSAPAAKHGPSRRASVDGGANEYLLALSSSSSDETDTSSSSGEGAIAPPRRSVGSGPPRPYPIRSVITGSSARFTMGTRSDRFGYPATPSPSPAPVKKKKKSLFNGLLSSPFVRSSLNKQPSPSKPVASAFRRTASSTPARGSTDGDAKLRPPAAINKAEEEHRLRILYTQHLQWRLVNAQAGAALSSQTNAAERTLSGAWISILRLRKSVAVRKMQLQLLRNNCKLFPVLRGQMKYLEEWSFLERDYAHSLAGTTQALNATILRLPVSNGAMVVFS